MPKPLAAITGASAGLGAVFARKLAARGYDLLLIARRGDRLSELGRELERAHGSAAEVSVADLSAPEDVRRVAQRLAAEPRLALLVNNAGFGTKGAFVDAPIEEQARMHRVHIDALLHLTHAALGGMVERGAGGIINVSSVAAFVRSRGSVSYCATKSWINAFTEGLYLELRGAGSPVTVQALCPGFTYTEFHDVAGVDRATIPKWIWLSAESVVDASLAGLDRRKLFVVPGWKYRLIVAVVSTLPARLRVAMEEWSPHRRDR
ncbi:MAG: SDR family NAD(P)-dependent oxidoreductase [Bryobacteraceae bacterium]